MLVYVLSKRKIAFVINKQLNELLEKYLFFNFYSDLKLCFILNLQYIAAFTFDSAI